MWGERISGEGLDEVSVFLGQVLIGEAAHLIAEYCSRSHVPSSLDLTKNARIGSKNCHQRIPLLTTHGIAECPDEKGQYRQSYPRVCRYPISYRMGFVRALVVQPEPA